MISINLKPALTSQKLESRLQRDFDQYGKRGIRRILAGLLPQKMIEPLIQLSGISNEKTGSQINSDDRKRIAELLKSLCFTIERTLPLSSAMVTAGGVSLNEVDPRTMESRLIRGLYLCGEVIDIEPA